MKTFITILTLTVFSCSINAQSISLNDVNSSNILEFYRQNQQANLDNGFSSSDITVQIGNGNVIEMVDQTPKYLELVQNGNYNTTLFDNPNNYPTNAQISVTGSGNYIDITGSNSISDGMKININANDMTIFMRNY